MGDDELEGMSTQMAERLAMLHGLNAPEFFDKSLFRKLIGRLEQEKVLHRNDQNKLTFDGRLEKMTEETRQLLSSELRRSILKVTLELRSD